MFAKSLKILGWAFAALVLLVVVAVLILKAITDEQYREWVESGLQESTGRKVSIQNLSLDIGKAIKLQMEGVRIANASWGDSPDMLNLGQLQGEILVWPLLSGIAELRFVTSQGDMVFETSETGQSNWALWPTDETGEDVDQGMQLPVHPLVRELRIEDINLKVMQDDNSRVRRVALESIVLDTPDLETLLSLQASVDGMPVTLSGNLGKLEQVLTGPRESLDLTGQVSENKLAVKGTWGPMLPAANLDLTLNADAPSVSRLAELFGVSLADLGRLSLNLEMTARDGQFALTRILTDLQGESVTATLNGSVGDLLGLNQLDLSTSASTEFFNQLVEQLGVELPVTLPSDVKLDARITGQLKPLQISKFETTVHDDGLRAVITGSIGNTLAFQQVKGSVVIDADSTAILGRYLQQEIPELGAVSITGDITSDQGQVAVTNLVARISSSNINFDLTGTIDDALAVSGLDLKLAGEVLSLNEENIAGLKRLFADLEVNVPMDLLPQSASISTTITGNKDNLEARDLSLELQDMETTATATGSIGNVNRFSKIDTAITIKGSDSSILSKYVGTEVPDLGSFDIDAKIQSTEAGYRLETVDARVSSDRFNSTLRGSIDELLTGTGINAVLESSVDSLSDLSEPLDTDLPETLPIAVKVNITGSLETGQDAAQFSANAKMDNTELNVEGALANLKSMDDVQVTIDLQSKSLADFNAFTEQNFPDNGPVKISGNLVAQNAEVDLNDFRLRIAEQEASGNLGLVFRENYSELLKVKGQVTIPYLDLSPFVLPESEGITAEAGKQAAPNSEIDELPSQAVGVVELRDAMKNRTGATLQPSDKVASNRLFSTDPLPFEFLRKVDADVSLTGERITIGKTELSDVKARATLKQGLLIIDPLTADAQGGAINGTGHLNARGDSASLDLELVLKNVPMPRFGGGLDSSIDVNGNGGSVAQIMAGLDGQILVVMRDGKIPNTFATRFGNGLLSFSQDKEFSEVECGILRVEIEDGLADFDDHLAVQLSDVTWRGGGEVNLKTERIGIGITPKPRTGLGITPGTLASLVYVGGTIKEPSVRLNPKDVAIKYGKYVAYLSTGGLSLAAEALINLSQANEDICKQILNGTIFAEEGSEIVKTQKKANKKKADSGTQYTQSEND